MSNSQLINQQVAQVDAILYKLRCYRTPQRVRSDVLDALRSYPSLQPRSGSIASTNTQQTVLLYLAGTVPIFYNNVQYNIPVNIWIVDNFPYSPPICHVTPTPDMVIKPKHRHVDSSGMCYLPYLSSWNPNSCNLQTLINTMSQVFSADPPVRSAPKQTTPTNPTMQTHPQQQQQQPQNNYVSPLPQKQPNQQQQIQTNPYASPLPQNVNTPYGYPQQPQQQPYQQQQTNSYPNNNYQTPNPTPNPVQYNEMSQNPLPQYPPKTPTSNSNFEDPAIVAKRNALRSATERLQGKLQKYFADTTKQIDDLIVENAKQDDKQRNIAIEKQSLDLQHGQISSDIDNLTKSFDDITKWLDANDSATLDIDQITEPKDPHSKQLLYLVAEDATMEDTLYYLEKNLMSGELNLDVFLKNVRSLSTEQFLKRATIKKIHERQRSMSVK